MKQRQFIEKNKGFTLIELSVVLAIIAVMATIAVPNVVRYLEKARDAKRISDMQVLGLAFESFYDDHAHYPGYTDDNDLTEQGECIGVRGLPVPATGPCAVAARRDGAVDDLLRLYIHGPIPHDPLYANRGDQFFYSYDPYHSYFIPPFVDWNTGPTAGCDTHWLPNPTNTLPIPFTNRTAVYGLNQFETDTVEHHIDTCRDSELLLSTADYNIALPEVGFGNDDSH